jgi:hypothetical protein
VAVEARRLFELPVVAALGAPEASLPISAHQDQFHSNITPWAYQRVNEELHLAEGGVIMFLRAAGGCRFWAVGGGTSLTLPPHSDRTDGATTPA